MDKVERVNVIIPNWNGRKWLPVCLESLRRQTFQDFITYVVDNGSKDDSVEFINTNYPEVRVIRNAENLGFAGGMNVGMRQTRGEYIVALNNDTETDANWVAELVRQMDKHPKAGSAASALLDFKDRTRIDSLGDGYSFDGRSYKVGSGEVFRPSSEPFEILSPCAAASIYRRDMLDRIGLYDEDFFAYMEDVDLGLRAQLAGYSCICIPTALVYHMGSATSGGEPSAFSIRQTSRNVYRVIIKNVPALLLPLFITLALASQISLAAVSLVHPRFKWFRANLRAFSQGLVLAAGDVPASIAARRRVRALTKLGTMAFLRLLVESYKLDAKHRN